MGRPEQDLPIFTAPIMRKTNSLIELMAVAPSFLDAVQSLVGMLEDGLVIAIVITEGNADAQGHGRQPVGVIGHACNNASNLIAHNMRQLRANASKPASFFRIRSPSSWPYVSLTDLK